MKKMFIIGSIIISLIFIFFVLDIFLNNGGGSSKQVVPTVTPFPQDPSGQAVSTYSLSPSDRAAIDKNGKKGALINIVPYTGQYFSFDFDFSKNTFVLMLDKNNIAKGNANFDLFLKQNGIQDRSWFNDLIVVY